MWMDSDEADIGIVFSSFGNHVSNSLLSVSTDGIYVGTESFIHDTTIATGTGHGIVVLSGTVKIEIDHVNIIAGGKGIYLEAAGGG